MSQEQQQSKSIKQLNGTYKLKYSHKDNYGAHYFKTNRSDYQKIKKYQKENDFTHCCTHRYEKDGENQYYFKIKNPSECLIKKKDEKRTEEDVHLVFYPWRWEKDDDSIEDVMKGIRCVCVG